MTCQSYVNEDILRKHYSPCYLNFRAGNDCGGYSLYSESLSEDNIATATKDLDRCARLLNDMLVNDKGSIDIPYRLLITFIGLMRPRPHNEI